MEPRVKRVETRGCKVAALLIFASALFSFAAWAQPKEGLRRVGYLQPSVNEPRLAVFKEKLRELGHVEGQTLAIEYRTAHGQYEKLKLLAEDLVRAKVDVIMADGGTPSVMAARAATSTTPIVFAFVADPVAQGIVRSLSHPGGNVTGMSVQYPEAAPKMLQLLHELLPDARHIVVLNNPANPAMMAAREPLRLSVRVLPIELRFVDVQAPSEFDKLFADLERNRPDALVVPRDAFFLTEGRRLSILAARSRIPTMGGDSVFPEAGALASYGPDSLDMIRRCAVLVDKILKGAKPGDLPVEQPTKFDLTINTGTAKALGVRLTPEMLLRADRLIQ